MLWPIVIAATAFPAQPNPNPNPIVNERLDQRPPKPIVSPQRRPRGRTAIAASQSNARIRTIDFQGVEAPARVAEAAKAFLGRQATRATLTELAGALSKAYELTDIALYTVAVPDQNFKDGVVVVELVEGWVDKVEIKGPHNQHSGLLERRADKLIGEKPLSRSRFERQSALMQSIPGLKLDATFENPEGDESVALVVTPHQKRWDGAIGINNYGSELIGTMVLQAGVDFYHTLADGDQLSFSGYATPNFRNYRALDAAYAIPIGEDGLKLSANAAWIETRARKIDIKGNAKAAGLTLSYPILRRAKYAADVSFGVDGVNSDNALFGNIFATERSRAARLAGAFVSASESDNLQLSAVVSHGLDIFGANVGDTGAQIGFTKFNFAASYERLLSKRLFARLNGSAQYSSDRLPAVELFSIGGASLGRAFGTGISTGDRGLGGFAELAYRPLSSGKFQRSEIYLFSDAAALKINRRPTIASRSFSLASAGGGLRVKYKDRVQVGVEAAQVLKRPFDAYRKDLRINFYYTLLF